MDGWRPAEIVACYEEDDSRPGYKEKHEEGYKWRVNIAGLGEQDLPEEAVIAPHKHGVAAVLRAAAAGGDETLVEWLLEAGANLYETDVNGNTALIYAARQGQEDVCRLLLRSKQGKDRPDAQAKKLGNYNGIKELRNKQRQNACAAVACSFLPCFGLSVRCQPTPCQHREETSRVPYLSVSTSRTPDSMWA